MSATAILVSGLPGSGKSTLARRLAEILRVPFIARDDVRGGLLFTAGAWGESIDRIPSGDDAVEHFLRIVEAMLTSGVSCVIEYVVRTHRPEDLDRIMAVAECRVIVTRCEDPLARFARRSGDDRLIANRAVLDATGHDSVESHTDEAIERMRRVEREMRREFPVPVLEVNTTDGYDPPIDAVVEFVTGSVDRQPRSS